MSKTKQSFNTRQQKYKQNILIGMSKYNAAKAAGYSESTAKSRTKDLDKRIAMPDVLEQAGLSDAVLTLKLIELMNATKVIGYLHNYKKSDKVGAEAEKVTPDEIVSNEFLDTPDWSARAKGMEIALKLKGMLRDKVDHNVAVTYTHMGRIIMEHKQVQKLDVGEDIPQSIKERMN